MKLFQDGVQVGSLLKSGPLSTNPSVDAAIGNQPSGAGARPFDGWIDEARIYNRALTPTEVLLLSTLARPFCLRPDQN